MNYIQCTQQEFEQVINSLEEGSYIISHDVGRTHGMSVYQRMGSGGRLVVIASVTWLKQDNVRVFTYEIAKYLKEAYCK